MTSPVLTRAVVCFSQARDKIDNELTRIKNYLEQTGLGYKKSLVDAEGYPLPDIDHHRILSERQRAARLLNDRKRIEYILDTLTQTMAESPLYVDLERYNPMAIVDEVSANSPAEKSGLINGDFLLSFGSATSLSQLSPQIVEGKPVTVKVFRVDSSGRNIIEVTIIPAMWEGQGLVGAHLMPFSG